MSADNMSLGPKKETLLERRIRQRDTAIRDLFEARDRLYRALGEDPHSVSMALDSVLEVAQRAARLGRCAEDLDDVAKYGPDGGR